MGVPRGVRDPSDPSPRSRGHPKCSVLGQELRGEPKGAPCGARGQGEHRGAKSWRWFGGVGLAPNWGLCYGIQWSALTPRARCPLFGHHRATGAPEVTPKRGRGRWGRGEQRAAASWSPSARSHACLEPVFTPPFPCQELLSVATTRSGPKGHLQPFPSTYPISLPLRPTSMRPRRCRNNRLTKGYF